MSTLSKNSQVELESPFVSLVSFVDEDKRLTEAGSPPTSIEVDYRIQIQPHSSVDKDH